MIASRILVLPPVGSTRSPTFSHLLRPLGQLRFLTEGRAPMASRTQSQWKSPICWTGVWIRNDCDIIDLINLYTFYTYCYILYYDHFCDHSDCHDLMVVVANCAAGCFNVFLVLCDFSRFRCLQTHASRNTWKSHRT